MVNIYHTLHILINSVNSTSSINHNFVNIIFPFLMQMFKYFLTFHETQPENICKKLWDLWNNRKTLVEESIDYFDPRHQYWSQVLRYHMFVFNTQCVSIILINPTSFVYLCSLYFTYIPINMYVYKIILYIILLFLVCSIPIQSF